MNRRYHYVRLAIAACLIFAGCNSGPKLPPMAPVSGIVTLDEKPVAGAQVQFVPAAGVEGPPALGFTDEQGRYALKSAGKDGAIVGQHQVRIEARAKPKDETDTLPPLITPERYADTATSGLTATVEAGKSNVVDFPLRSVK